MLRVIWFYGALFHIELICIPNLECFILNIIRALIFDFVKFEWKSEGRKYPVLKMIFFGMIAVF